ncbi:MAG: acetyl-CoA carboxylase biotin carboxyl carrier protein [Alphaproteobacteria bacterium]|nr:acetyl-CoA carboxylase biotin carboxyl carrier protein [Alphaproteobacteria bacterium]
MTRGKDKTPIAAEPAESAAEGGRDAALIRTLAGLLKETELTEIEIERDGFRIRVARGGGGMVFAGAPSFATQGHAPAPGHAGKPQASDISQHPGAVNSPMVGTAYVAPSPGAAPFVRQGDSVSEGQTLLIVEAMKTMNPIAAPRSGKVVQILIKDGQPVEFGEVLMLIE